MRLAYSRIAWGLALALIDFRIQFFDVLPDVLGYFLIIMGLSGIRPTNRKFKVARAAASVLLLISIPSLIGQANMISLTNPVMPAWDKMLLLAADTVLEMVMMYGIAMGIREQARQARLADLQESARKIWHSVFGLGAIWLFCFPFYQNVRPGETAMIILAVGFAYFVACLWMIALARRAGRKLGHRRGNGEQAAESVNL